MRYYLDCEFDGFGGKLMSLALVREDGAAIYLIYEGAEDVSDPWVRENVVPLLRSIPEHRRHCMCLKVTQKTGAYLISEFLAGDSGPYIVADWPDDISYFCKAVITAPGFMSRIQSLRFEMVRVDSYPTDIKGAIQHNALWDALALWRLYHKVANV